MMADQIYLLPYADDRWRATFASESLPQGATPFIAEASYPAELFYERTDLNGSSVIEEDVCVNREELLESLAWCGKCGYTILQLWDFDYDSPGHDDAKEIFYKGAASRMRKICEEQEQFMSTENLPPSVLETSLSTLIHDASNRKAIHPDPIQSFEIDR